MLIGAELSHTLSGSFLFSSPLEDEEDNITVEIIGWIVLPCHVFSPLFSSFPECCNLILDMLLFHCITSSRKALSLLANPMWYELQFCYTCLKFYIYECTIISYPLGYIYAMQIVGTTQLRLLHFWWLWKFVIEIGSQFLEGIMRAGK